MKRLILIFLLLPIAFSATPFRFINDSVVFNNESVFVSYFDCNNNFYSLKEFFDSYVFVLYLLEDESDCANYTLVEDNEFYNVLHFSGCDFYNNGSFFYYTWSCNNYSHFALESLNNKVPLESFMSVCASNNTVKSTGFTPTGCNYDGGSFRGEVPRFNGTFIVQEFNYLNDFVSISSWFEPGGLNCAGGDGYKYCNLNEKYQYIVFNENYSATKMPIFHFKPELTQTNQSHDYFTIFVILILLIGIITYTITQKK